MAEPVHGDPLRDVSARNAILGMAALRDMIMSPDHGHEWMKNLSDDIFMAAEFVIGEWKRDLPRIEALIANYRLQRQRQRGG